MNTANNFNDIALVVPVYNSDVYLAGLFILIDDVVGRMDIYFMDDCSSDQTLEMIMLHYGEKVNIIRNERNKGASFTRNRALKEINKNFLIFIDPDITLETDDLFKLSAYRHKYDVVFPQIIYFNGKPLTPVNDYERQRCTNSAIFIINREMIEKKQQFFDEDMKIYVEDNDFFSRLWALKLKFKFCGNIVAKHPEKKIYSEEHYYQKVKNSLLFFLKNEGIIEFRFNGFVWIIINLCLFFFAAVLNRNFTVASGGFENIRYTNKNRLKLIRFFFKAIYWNISNIGSTLKKRKLIKKQIKILSG